MHKSALSSKPIQPLAGAMQPWIV